MGSRTFPQNSTHGHNVDWLVRLPKRASACADFLRLNFNYSIRRTNYVLLNFLDLNRINVFAI